MMARSTRGSNQRPDTLMQDRTSAVDQSSLATHGRTIHWVRGGGDDRDNPASHVRFAPKADKLAELSLSPLCARADAPVTPGQVFTPIRNVELPQVRHFGRCQAGQKSSSPR